MIASSTRPLSNLSSRLVCLLALAGLFASPWAFAQADGGVCGNPFVNGYGPFDYRAVSGQQRQIVEQYHFTPAVESLVSGITHTVAADIDYTLRAFPNHHRALVSMMNLGARMKTPKPPGAGVTVECYFVKALTFRPDDSVARMLYAKYLAANARKPEALQNLDMVAEQAKENAFTHYNLGLIYLELAEHSKALARAHSAMALGFSRPELKQALMTAGQWAEPKPEAAEAAASSPPAAASAPGSN